MVALRPSHPQVERREAESTILDNYFFTVTDRVRLSVVPAALLNSTR
jgi:hypothetical protein